LLVVVLAAAAAAAFALRGHGTWSAVVGFAGLGAAAAMAAGLDPSSSSTVLGLPLAASPYSRLVIIRGRRFHRRRGDRRRAGAQAGRRSSTPDCCWEWLPSRWRCSRP